MNNKINKNYTFSDVQKNKFDIEVIESIKIGKGNYSDVYKITGTLSNIEGNLNYNNGDTNNFILKLYNTGDGSLHSFSAHSAMKLKNITTYSEYYISQDNSANLMEEILFEDEILIACNDLDGYSKFELNRIDNFYSFLSKLEQDIISSKNYIELESESLFFIYNKKTNYLRHCYGDLNTVIYSKQIVIHSVNEVKFNCYEAFVPLIKIINESRSLQCREKYLLSIIKYSKNYQGSIEFKSRLDEIINELITINLKKLLYLYVIYPLKKLIKLC